MRSALIGIGALLWTLIIIPAAPAAAQSIPEALLEPIEFRSIGPALFGGRITDIELVESEPWTIYVAAASGGLFRSTNNGTTWECIFENQGTISIGDIAIDPTNPDVIWVGTGEANNQRSSYWGDGIYKSADGGETWEHLGLEETHHIGRIVIDPDDSDVVYVAALGHLYTHNEERGLYKTADGGKTWTKSLYISPEVGVADVALNPDDPQIIYAASYERLRRAWNFDGAGPGSAIYRSTDAGRNWEKLGGGLPEGEIGRIGLSIYPNDPDILYATVSNQNRVPVEPEEDASREPDLGFEAQFVDGAWTIASVREESSAAEAGLQEGDVIVDLGGVQITSAWSVIGALSTKSAEDSITFIARRNDEEIIGSIELGRERGRGRTREVGGEVYRTDDGGDTWTRTNEDPVGGSPPYYYGQIRIDPNDPERLYILSVPLSMSEDGGKTWSGNIAGSVHVDHHALVIDPEDSSRLILGNDGGLCISYDRGATWDHYRNLPLSQFYAVGVDMQIPFHVYGGTQDNGTWGGPSRSRGFGGIDNSDWYTIGGGDGFYAQADPRDPDTVYGESQFGAIYRLDKRTGQRTGIRPEAREGQERHRFNWNSPILISHHNPEIIYFGGNRLFKSFNRGDTWAIVSEDLTTANEEKVSGNVPHCTITTIAESPLDPRLVVVGTDDGLLQWSEDGGISFMNMTDRLADLPEHWWCSRVELSRHDVNVAYASFTGYREDDFRALLYRTADRGATWQSIVNDLPAEPVNVIREDPRAANVLYVGTEFGAYASIDGGATWNELDSGLPTIPVHDLIVHPRDRDIVLATHGRGFYVADVSPLQELNAEVLAEDAHLFTIEDAYMLGFRSSMGVSGDRGFSGENAPNGAAIWYMLKEDAAEDAISLTIRDVKGEEVRTLELDEGDRSGGLHRVQWDFRGQADDDDEGRGGGRRGRFSRRASMVEPGTYTAVLKVGEAEISRDFHVLSDPITDE